MKILCLGNSITHHAPAPDIGWYGDYGMAASAKEKDYVHRLSALLAENGIHADIYDANIADFERNPDTYDFALFDGFLKLEPDVLVLRISENVPSDKYEAFGPAYLRLIDRFRSIGTKHILTVGPFWHNEVMEAQIMDAAKATDSVYLSLDGLDAPAYKAIGLFEHQGVAGHPGDLGMEEIASRICRAICKL